MVQKPRQAVERGCAPPRNTIVASSAMQAAHGSKSSTRGGRRISRSVSMTGPFMSLI